MPYLVKSEINGIQSFIFNVQSKGAAKTLKARSFFVEAVSLLLEHLIVEKFKNTQLLYNGGGNVYAIIKDDAWSEYEFNNIEESIKLAALPYNLAVTIAGFYAESLEQIGLLFKQLNYKTAVKKLKAPTSPTFFQPYIDNFKSQELFMGFTGEYARHNSYTIQSSSLTQPAAIKGDSINLLNARLTLGKSSNPQLLPLPLWNSQLLTKYKTIIDDKRKLADINYTEPQIGNIIGFEHLAAFAGQRTGTTKLGVLKMDVDNLGKLFQSIKDVGSNGILSNAFKDFFSKDLYKLLETSFPGYKRITKGDKEIEKRIDSVKYFDCQWAKENYFKHNIYPVYAGGDDCFLIGGWDAIVEFAIAIQKSFSEFEQGLRQNKIDFNAPITLSASLIIIDEHYPVVRFAEIAQQRLALAKQTVDDHIKDASGNAMKNKISFLGHIFSWRELEEVVKVKNIFLEMIIKYDEAKGFLQRIIKEFNLVDNAYWHNCQPSKPFDPALLWRFKYGFRDISNKPYFKAYYYKIFFSETDGLYQKYVWNMFSDGKELSQVLPVAARWAEYLCRT